MESAESLLQLEERFRLLVDSVVDYAIFILDREGYVRTWNSGAERIKGYRAKEIIGEHFSRFYRAEAVASGWPQHELQQAAQFGRFEDEGWRIRKDGSKFWANVVITALRSESGQLQGFAKITRDLTERKEHDEVLRRSEERFRLFMEAVTDYAIFLLDPNGYVLTWNLGAQRMKGYLPEEIIGKHFSQFYPPEVIESGWPEYELQQAAEKGRFRDEGWRVRNDGSKFWAEVIITALRDQAGLLHGFAKITRDLSERKRAQALAEHGAQREELLDSERAARIEAQRVARSRDEFLAMLSHELRTPLNAILGWAQILQRSSAPTAEDVRRGIDAIERNARAQVHLIDELLDLSRILAGRITLDVQPLMPAGIVQGVAESAEPAARVKGVRLEKILDPQAGPVSGDPVRLQQIVSNLLSNAIKFTPKGGRVQVLLERVNSHIELTVSDTGIGIAPAFLPQVFDRFSQQNSSASRSYGGLGLGLAIAKQLVELQGGTLRAKSAGEGRGASFVVNLPLIVAVSAQPDRLHPTHSAGPDTQTLLPKLDGVRVLVVDDEPDARDLIRRVLQEHGAVVAAVASGQEALRALAAEPPHVLLSDIGMPGMDGYQFIRSVRAGDPDYHRVPAIALTAFARSEDRKKALLAGYQTHLAKPFDIAELVIVVAGLVDRAAKR